MAGYPSVGPPRPQNGWLGLDLRSNDLLRNPDAASRCTNVDFRRTGTKTMRKGSKVISSSAGVCGSARYARISTADASETNEKLLLSDQLYKLSTGTLGIVYTPGTVYSAINVNILLDTTTRTWHFVIIADGTTLLDFNMGVGIEEVTPLNMSDLMAAINAVAGFAATNTGSNISCAFLPSLFSESFSANVISIPYEYATVVNQAASGSNPFAALYAKRNSLEFEHASNANLKNVIYFATGYDELTKYDGQKVYRAGMPKPSTPSAAVVASATGLTGTNIRFRISFRQVDAQNNSIEGIISDASGLVSPAADNVDVTYSRIAPSQGFNTDVATVNGIQAGVSTITVDAGHTIKVGDVIYLNNTATGLFVTRTITAITATTIAFAPAEGVVSVADYNSATGAGVISANLRVAVYAQQVTDGSYYFIAEFPHDSTTASPTMRLTQTAFGGELIFPITGTESGLPPQGRYVAAHKGLLFISGNLSNYDRIYHSDSSSPEAFPPSANFSDIRTQVQSAMSGLYATHEYLAIFKRNSSHTLTGDFDTEGFFRFRIDDISLSTGCQSHRAIVQVSDGSLLFVHTKGVYRRVAEGEPVEVSGSILPIFARRESSSDRVLMLRRSQAVYDQLNEKVLFFLPCESVGTDRYANSNSKTLVLDVGAPAPRWMDWSAINAAGGFIIVDDSLYWIERALDSVTGSVRYSVNKRLALGNEYDYVDHYLPIPYEYVSGWDSGDGKSHTTYEKPLRLKLFSQDEEISSSFSINVDMNTDFVGGLVQSMLVFDFGSGSSSGYGLEPYGLDSYGAPQQPTLMRKLASRKTQTWRYRFYKEFLYEFPIISSYETEVANAYVPMMKK